MKERSILSMYFYILFCSLRLLDFIDLTLLPAGIYIYLLNIYFIPSYSLSSLSLTLGLWGWKFRIWKQQPAKSSIFFLDFLFFKRQGKMFLYISIISLTDRSQGVGVLFHLLDISKVFSFYTLNNLVKNYWEILQNSKICNF